MNTKVIKLGTLKHYNLKTDFEVKGDTLHLAYPMFKAASEKAKTPYAVWSALKAFPTYFSITLDVSSEALKNMCERMYQAMKDSFPEGCNDRREPVSYGMGAGNPGTYGK